MKNAPASTKKAVDDAVNAAEDTAESVASIPDQIASTVESVTGAVESTVETVGSIPGKVAATVEGVQKVGFRNFTRQNRNFADTI